MQTQTHPLEPFFQQAVRNSYEGKAGSSRSRRDQLRGAVAVRVLRCRQSLQHPRWIGPPH
jgi:hypothetical protein